jgi:multidrug efflux pump subunit AcrA (membrane-fusion protein)
VDQDNAQLQQMEIVAPFDGVVVMAQGQPGDQVNAYTAVVSVANPNQLELAVSIPQTNLSQIAVGQKATIKMDIFPKAFTGVVSALPSVNTAATSTSGSSPGESSSSSSSSSTPPPGTAIDQSPRVMPQWPGPGAQIGELASVTIVIQKKSNVLLIPTSAVNTINGRTFVLLDDGGHQKPVDIQIGIQTDQETEVVSGLKEGQRVFARNI